jgi:hypothetical protein
MALGDDTADQGRVPVAGEFDQFRIKGHKGGWPAIGRKDFGCAGQKSGVAVEVTLEFQEQSGSAIYQIEQFSERKNPIRGRLEFDALELRRA